MSRRGNCHDNAVAESFLNLLKRERIRRKIHRTRAEARQDVFDDIEMSINPPGSMHATGCCHPSSSNDSTKRKPRASRKLGAIQFAALVQSKIERQGVLHAQRTRLRIWGSEVRILSGAPLRNKSANTSAGGSSGHNALFQNIFPAKKANCTLVHFDAVDN